MSANRPIKQRANRGQTLTEYALVGTLVLSLSASAIMFLGQGVQERFDKMVQNLNIEMPGAAGTDERVGNQEQRADKQLFNLSQVLKLAQNEDEEDHTAVGSNG